MKKSTTKMRKISTLFVIFFAAISLMSCVKDPVAQFSTDKSVYEPGETVYLNNYSIDAEHFMWILPNAAPAYSKDYQYHIPSDVSGSLAFTLIAYSKNRKKENSTTQTVQVEKPKGNATFWTSSGQYQVTVTFQGMTGKITRNYPSNPGCGADGCANFNNITPGTYPFSATNGAQTWNGNITIRSGECSTMQLTGGYKVIENPTSTPERMED